MESFFTRYGRTPQGVRGLKLCCRLRGSVSDPRRTPQGVRGLKCRGFAIWNQILRRTPQGVRGLKYIALLGVQSYPQVAPRKGCVD